MPPFAYVAPDARVRTSEGVVFPEVYAREPSRFGNRVVFWIPGPGTDGGAVVLRDLRGGRRVVARGNVRSPRFSPDGRTVAFTRFEGGDWRLFVVPVSGGRATRVPTGERGVFQPVWTAAGLFAQDMERVWSRTRAGVASTPVGKVFPGKTLDSSGGVFWRRADGSAYLLTGAEVATAVREEIGGGQALFRRAPDGRTIRLTPPEFNLSDARPVGGWVFFSARWAKGKPGVFAVPAQGGKIVRVADGSEPG